MPETRRPTLRRALRTALPAVLALACSDNPILPPAQVPVAEQQITLYGLTGTPVNTPSGYNMIQLVEVRLDQTNDFDFALEIAPESTLGLGTGGTLAAALLPRGYFGFAPDGGLQRLPDQPLDSIHIAPETGYERNFPVRIDSGAVLVAASRIQFCNFNVYRPKYAKLEIRQLDYGARRAVIRVVLDPNCGYRSLDPGIPTR
jgi:hypothetical protein